MIFHFDCIDGLKFSKNDYYDGINKSFGESVTDETYYIPNSESVRNSDRLKDNTSVLCVYDFSDGVDNGSDDMLIGRKPGSDIVEVTTQLADLNKRTKESIEKDVKELNEKEVLESVSKDKRTEEIIKRVIVGQNKKDSTKEK